MALNVVRVGVGVLIKDPTKSNHVFAGIRKGSHGANRLALPGGHLELFESWEQCAKREIKEETGLIVQQDKIQFGHVTNDIMESENKHYVTIFMMCECTFATDIPRNLEPHKCEGWESYSWDELRNIATASSTTGSDDNGEDKKASLTLFGPLQKLVEDNPENVLRFLNSG